MSRNRTQFAILAILRTQPMSGYEVREFCKTRLNQFWNESFGQIYPTLKKLAEEDLIRIVDRKSENTRATYYEITQSGLSVLKDWVMQTPAPRVVRDEVLLKLVCGTEMHSEAFAKHVATVRHRAREHQDIQKLAKAELDSRAKDHPDSPYWQLILRYGELATRARLEWCDEAEAFLSKQNKRERK